jgi:AP-2 complex subunit mu-1
MFSSFSIFSPKGDLLVYRTFRPGTARNDTLHYGQRIVASKLIDEYPLVEINSTHFASIVTEKKLVMAVGSMSDSNAAVQYVFLEQFASLMRQYFRLEETEITKNLALIHSLLDEIVDFGYPQFMDQDILRSYITGVKNSQQYTDPNEIAKITLTATGATSWRPENIIYQKNEIYLDVIESVNCLFSAEGNIMRADVTGVIRIDCRLSGMPQCKLGINEKIGASLPESAKPGATGMVSLDDVRFHHCVRLSERNSEKVISFVPPDGVFDVMNYRISNIDGIVIPFKIAANIETLPDGRISLLVKVESLFKKEIEAKNVVLRWPVNAIRVSKQSDQQTAFSFNKAKIENGQCLVWGIGAIHGESTKTLTCEIEPASGGMGIIDSSKNGRAPFSLDFEVPMLTASGMKIKFLNITEKSNYPVKKWVAYQTKAGSFQHRI